MKKHNCNEAIEIFKGMFEGWSVVTKGGEVGQLQDITFSFPRVKVNGYWFGTHEISHLEQTIPMNGDEVWAWNGDQSSAKKYIYIGQKCENTHVVKDPISDILYSWKNVELTKPKRQLTIQEATEIIRKGERVEGEFEIIKD